MIFRGNSFDDKNVLAYFQVKNGAIIDRTKKNNLITNITSFGKEDFEYCNLGYYEYLRFNPFTLSDSFFMEYIYNQSNFNEFQSLLTNNGDRQLKFFTSMRCSDLGIESALRWPQPNSLLNKWKVVLLQRKNSRLSLYVDGVKRMEKYCSDTFNYYNPVIGRSGGYTCGFGKFKQCIIVNNTQLTDSPTYNASLDTDLFDPVMYNDIKHDNIYIQPLED